MTLIKCKFGHLLMSACCIHDVRVIYVIILSRVREPMAGWLQGVGFTSTVTIRGFAPNTCIMGRARNRSMQQHNCLQVRRAKASHNFTNGNMTLLKFNDSTRNLAGSKSVSDRRVQ